MKTIDEQPPSAEARILAETIAACWFPQPHRRREFIARIDALCEQRVSAETERCALIAAAQKTEAALEQHRAIEGEDKACWLWAFDTANLIECAIRASAERPAPPQQTIHAYLCVGLSHHVDCKSKPGPDCPKCTRLFAGGRQQDMNSSAPSALASTGEQPDCGKARCEMAEHREPAAPSVDRLLAEVSRAESEIMALELQRDALHASLTALVAELDKRATVFPASTKDAIEIAHAALAKAVPPTGCVELGERSNTESSPTTTAATRWQATLEAEKAAILDFVVDGKIGDDPSPAAVVDYTEPARTMLEQWMREWGGETRPYTGSMMTDLQVRLAVALSAVASEHQAEIVDLRAEADNDFTAWKSAKEALRQVYEAIGIDRGGDNWPEFMQRLKAHLAAREAALLARLREPEMRETVVEAGTEVAAEAVSNLPMGQRAWDQKDYNIAKTAALAALAVITEKLNA